MTSSETIELRLADGSLISLARDEAQRLSDKLHDSGSLDGALSLAAQLANELRRPIALMRSPIELLRREERALRSVLDAAR